MLGVPVVPRLEQAEDFSPPMHRFVERLPFLRHAQIAGSLPIFPKKYRSSIAQWIHATSVLASIAATSVHINLPVLQCAGIKRRQVRVVWKSIDSLGRLGLILRTTNKARAIIILRHPCATISSTLRGEAEQKFSSTVAASEDYGIMEAIVAVAGKRRGLTIDDLRRAHPVERMAWIWVLTNEKAINETHGMSCCTTVRYEDVCRDPIGKMRKLFLFAGLDWHEQTEAFIRASTLTAEPKKFDKLTQGSDRYYSIFRDPVRSADKWKQQMKPEDVDRVYSVLRQSDLIRLYPEIEESYLSSAAVNQ